LNVFEHVKKRFEKTQFAPDAVFRCQKCNDAGILPVNDAFGNERWAECECAVQKRSERILAAAGFDVASALGLDSYEAKSDMCVYAKFKAEEFIQNFDKLRYCNGVINNYRNWFLIYGQSGSGKTMLGRAIVKALVQRRVPVRARAVKYYEMMQRLKARANDERYDVFLREFTEPELLFIDDLLKEKRVSGELTEADTTHLFAVIDTRYERCLPTIITTELTPKRITELDGAMYWRMSQHAFCEIVFEGKDCNYRKRI
jgi:DNA replication protein DnaC